MCGFDSCSKSSQVSLTSFNVHTKAQAEWSAAFFRKTRGLKCRRLEDNSIWSIIHDFWGFQVTFAPTSSSCEKTKNHRGATPPSSCSFFCFVSISEYPRRFTFTNLNMINFHFSYISYLYFFKKNCARVASGGLSSDDFCVRFPFHFRWFLVSCKRRL